MSDYHAESCSIERLEDIKQEWVDLQERADCSYFQSWGWIGTWLEQIAIDLHPVVVKVWLNGRLVGIGLFVARDIKRRIIFHSRAMLLNEYPFDGRNMVIEYNGMLAEKEHEEAVYKKTIQCLLYEFKEHNEFMFGAVTEDICSDSLFKMQVNDAKFFIKKSSQAWFVDLSRIPDNIDEYLASMSKNRRAQIRRSIRLYENQGSLQINEAQNIEEAQSFFDGLKVLHTQRWLSKGQPGSFANPRWEAFHRSLIQNRFDTGEIQLLRVGNGSAEIGYLYNFVWRKHIYVLQTGFGISADKRLMPGYVAHVLAIAYNRSKGMAVYDFMHGDNLYKKLLCNHNQKLLWVVLQRRRLSFLVEEFAVGIVRGFRKVTRCGE